MGQMEGLAVINLSTELMNDLAVISLGTELMNDFQSVACTVHVEDLAVSDLYVGE